MTKVTKEPKKGRNSKEKKEVKQRNIFLKILAAIGTFFKWIFRLVRGTFHFVCFILLLLGIAGAVIFTKVKPMYDEACSEAYDQLAQVKDTDFRMLSNTVIYDKDNKKIGEIKVGNYIYDDISDISLYIQNGYIASEDQRFKTHHGIDIQALARAGIALVKNKGKITQGGSTITQQVVKNCMLTQKKTFSRKLVEVMIAPEIERRYGKTKIMEYYCNTNYYGNARYGVESACRYYFGKKAKDVTLAEAAMLCGISNSPNKYNPVVDMELATEKKEQVLQKMYEQEYITEKEYKKALKQKIKIVQDTGDGSKNENYLVSYAISCAAQELMKLDGFQFQYVFDTYEQEQEYLKKYSKSYNEKCSLIRSGGYRIYTSLDRKVQKKLQKSVSECLSTYKEKDKKTKKYKLQGASVCIDNQTGYIIASVGGSNKNDDFNRANLSKSQPGSTIKPLLDYGPAIDVGAVNPSSIVSDSKIEGKYSPTNYGGGYRGDVPVREALARSLNTIAYRLFKMTGNKKAISYLGAMHFSSLSSVDTDADAVALGGFTNGVKVTDMAKGYSTIENNGKYSERTCIRKIDFQDKGTVYEETAFEKTLQQVYSEDTAFMMRDMMQGTFEEEYGTAHKKKTENQIYAGKTGTTNGYKDVWFCGFSAYYTTAVWVGCDTPEMMPGMTGSSKPLDIWYDFMEKMHIKKKKKDFDIPDTIALCKVKKGVYVDTDKLKQLDKTERAYEQRTNKYEYYSKMLHMAEKEYSKESKTKERMEKAEEAVEYFVKYTISTVEDAANLEENYQNTIEIIEAAGDSYATTELLQRAKQHYDKLSVIVENEWKTAISEYDKDKAERESKQSEIDADDGRTSALEYLKINRINKVIWYTNKLNARSYYNEVSKELIEDGRRALERCSGYSDYDSLKKDLESAIKRVKGLPEEPETNDIPETDEDDDNSYQDSYDDSDENEEEIEIEDETDDTVG